MAEQDSKPVLRCEVCDVKIQDTVSYETHMKGKKHAKTVEWLNKKEQVQSQGVFVRGFPHWASPDALKTFFSRFGDIKEFIYRGDDSPYVIIQFLNRVSAEECLSRPLFFHGWRLHVVQRKLIDKSIRGKKPGGSVEKRDDDDESKLKLLASYNDFESQLEALVKDLEFTDTKKPTALCQSLEFAFYDTYPGCRAHVFGSRATGLAFKDSDVDIFMDLNLEDTNSPEIQSHLVNKAKRLLFRSRVYTQIISIPKAKTPIVKFVFTPANTHCDMSFKNALSVHNSALIKYMLSLDERLRPLMMIIKYWAKKNDISGSGKLTHYALVMFVMFYLQQLSPPLVPTVCSILNNRVVIDGWKCGFNESVWHPEHKNTMSIPELLIDFLKFCSVFEYDLKVICPLIGEAVPKTLFQVPDDLPVEMDQYKQAVLNGRQGLRIETDMCIQDPFELTHNLAGSVSAKKLKIFKIYCAEAAVVCEKVLSTPECFLPKLLEKMTVPKIKNETSSVKIVFRKNPVKEDEPEQLRFNAVFESVLKVFKEILKFDVEIESPDPRQSLRKIQKLDGQADVGNQSLESFEVPKKVHCSGTFRFWEGRKAAFKEIKFLPGDVDAITKEIRLSDYLVEKQVGESPVMKLICVFTAKQEPTHMELVIDNAECKKGEFVFIATFLQSRLSNLVDLYLNQPQNS